MRRLNWNHQWPKPGCIQLTSVSSARSARPGRFHNIPKSNWKQTNGILTGRANSWQPRQQGQALIEFALVLLFIILPITFVFVDGALMLFTLANVTNAAREGARAGAIYQCGTGGVNCTVDYTQALDLQVSTIDGARLSYVQNYLSGNIPNDTFGRLRNLTSLNECTWSLTYATTLNPTLDPPPGECPVGSGVPCPYLGNPYRAGDQITMNLTCPRRLLFGLVNASQINLSGSARMRIEPGGVNTP